MGVDREVSPPDDDAGVLFWRFTYIAKGEKQVFYGGAGRASLATFRSFVQWRRNIDAHCSFVAKTESMMSNISEQSVQRAGTQEAARAKPTIRSRLLIAVNVPLAGLVVVFLAYDYSSERARRLEDKRITLEEEAETLLPAVLQMRRDGASSVQQYIDTVCGRMQEVHSPMHHIAVELGDETFQAVSHHRASPGMLQAMREAAQSAGHRAYFDQTEFVVGSSKQPGATAYVSESLEDIYRSVIGNLLRRLAGFVILALVGAVVVNIVLTRVVSNPLQKLVGTVQKIAKGQLGAESETFRSAELDYLASEINAMSDALAAADHDRKTQMAKARNIQRNLLPQHFAAAGLSVAHVFEPADDVGGDYYDVVPLDDGAWLFCVADVTGHGVPAAMTAAMLKTLVQDAESCMPPDDIMQLINQRFMAVSPIGDFVTMTLVRVVPRTRKLQYASAGHEPAWLLSQNGDLRELSSTGIVLGVDGEASWETTAIDVVPGDRLLIPTDGVSETFGPGGQMFGHQRLVDAFRKSSCQPVQRAVETINEALRTHRSNSPQEDDVTLVLVEFSAEG